MQLGMTRLGTQLLDLLFPPLCGGCGAGGTFFCEGCERSLRPAEPPRCPRCWTPGPGSVCADCSNSPLDAARAPYVFEAAARPMIHGLKYRSLHALAEPLGALLAVYLLQEAMAVDLVVPVPLHP